MTQEAHSRRSRTPVLIGGAALLALIGGMAHWSGEANPPAETSPEVLAATETPRPSKTTAASKERTIARINRAAQRELSAKSADGLPMLPAAVPSLAEALSEDTMLEPKERVDALQRQFYLEEPLNDQEAAFLMDALRTPDVPASVSDSTRRALKNEIMNLLTLRLEDQEPFIELLQSMHQDETQDPVIRDYALQFLASLSAQGQGSDANPLQAQWAAINKATSVGYVTKDQALLGSTSLLHVLSGYRQGKLSAEELGRLKAAALRIAAREDIPDDARSTALQVCGQLKMAEAAKLAADIAASNRNAFALRIAAIATLAQIDHSETTIEFLQTLTDGPNARLRYPAQAALQNIYASQP